MTVNAICTTFRREGREYKKVLSLPCMWQEVEADELKKYGSAAADNAAVFIADVYADVQKGDYIIKGSCEELDDKAAYNTLKVATVERNDYGSYAMRHLKLGVK